MSEFARNARLSTKKSTTSRPVDPRVTRSGSDGATASVLTRDLFRSGGAASLAAADDPNAQFHSEPVRAASLHAFLKHRPDGDVWIFAYGSLIWNPAMKVAEPRPAHILGWHRTFCLSMTAGRGTAAQPGLALGLERGGACWGIAYRLDEHDLHSELPVLWSREMLFGGYVPQWVEVRGADNEPLGHAIAFTIDAHHRHYAGGLSRLAQLQRLATAAGSWGSAADYLFRTIGALRDHDIHDAYLEELGMLVEAALLLSIWPKEA